MYTTSDVFRMMKSARDLGAFVLVSPELSRIFRAERVPKDLLKNLMAVPHDVMRDASYMLVNELA